MTPVQQEIVNAIDQRNIFLLNKKYPAIQRISIWLGVIGGLISIVDHSVRWFF